MGAIKGQQSKKWTPAMRAAAALRARQLAERQRLAQQQADALMKPYVEQTALKLPE